MQGKHVSKHIWNGEEDKKLHIRQPRIKEVKKKYQRKLFIYYCNLMGYLKINVSLISALIERWRPDTHTFHMRCGEYTITLQDVSILLGLRVDRSPLIGPINLNWTDSCEELLGIRPQEGEFQGSVVKLSWLTHHFTQINNHDGNLQQVERFTRAWILRFIGGVLFVDKSSNKVSLRECNTHAWKPAVLAYLYREMCNTTDYKTKSIGCMWLRRGNQHIDNDDLTIFRRKLDIMKRHEAEVAETLQYMVSPQGRNTWTIDDLVPYVDKITILSEEQEIISEPVSHERGHGMYYTPPTFSQYPTQMYQYPFEGHQSDTSASSSTLGGVAETYPNFSWPAMTLSQQHDAPIPTPNVPLDGSSQSISFLILVDFGRPFARILVGLGISVHASSEGGIAASFPRGHHCAE
ncbi:Protein MAIN-LIKE 2 [Glycine soja]